MNKMFHVNRIGETTSFDGRVPIFHFWNEVSQIGLFVVTFFKVVVYRIKTHLGFCGKRAKTKNIPAEDCKLTIILFCLFHFKALLLSRRVCLSLA